VSITSFVLIAAVCAADPAAQFEVRVYDGEPVRGSVETMGAGGTLTFTDTKAISGGEWYGMRRAGVVLPPWPRDPHVELTNGDRIRGAIRSGDGDSLRLTVIWTGVPEQVIQIPVSSTRVAWLRGGAPDAEPAWLAGPRKRDVILARNGDVRLGALTAIDVSKSQVRFQVDGKDRDVPLSKVSAVAFNTDLARVRRPKGPYYRLVLADGSRLSVMALTFDQHLWTAQTLFKESVKIPADRVVAIDVEQGKAAYLAGLKPAKYQYQSFDGEDRSWVSDRNANGQTMRLKTTDGESTFDRGIGLHADCAITYALGGKYRRFESSAGLDARSGLRGDAILEITVDGKAIELPGGGRLTQSGGPVTLKVDINGAKELTIAVRPGNGGIVQDHVNLTDARLIP
jgi:NPCBM/NEW2 domain